MELTKIIYASVASELCRATEIEDILQVSVEQNKNNGITGILYFSNRYFLQYFEGDKPDVVATYSRITRDARHNSHRLIDQSTINTREFGMWSMGYIPDSRTMVPLNKKFMDDTQFNPMSISSAEAVALTFELRDLLPKAHYDDSTIENSEL